MKSKGYVELFRATIDDKLTLKKTYKQFAKTALQAKTSVSSKLYFTTSSGIDSEKSVSTLAMQFPLRRIMDFVGVVWT